MKKRLIICFVLILSLTFISAGWFGDMWGKITGQVPIPCLDNDNDGFKIGGGCGLKDCNDNNNAIYPGATEMCNGVDDDCDTLIDEGCQACTDNDNDGYFLEGGACGAIDCNDNNNAIYPGAPEICNNINDDCDLSIDEGGVCQTCNDSDGGITLNTSGFVEGYTNKLIISTYYNHPDECLDNTTVREYNCVNNATNFGDYNCVTELGQYYSCDSGACISSCPANWTAHDAPCINDTYTTYYIDENNCNEVPPANITTYCDGNNNNIIGDFCPLGIDSVKINNTLLNESEDYTDIGVQPVELKKDNATITFNLNFSENLLNLCPINVETSGVDDYFGYAIISDLTVSGKTIWFDKLNNDSESICIKDVEGGVSVNSFTGGCIGTNEILVDCPGTANVSNYIYNCQISGGKFKVWPLKHSAIIEMFPSQCIANWSCSDWGSCIDNNQTRTCTDLNSCNNTLSKPAEIQTCTEEAPAACVPNWHCQWGACGQDGFKYYTCEDLNDCGTSEGKPTKDGDVFECKKQSKSLWVIILAIIGIALLILGLIYFLKKKKAQAEEEKAGTVVQTPPPSQPPQTPQVPQVTPKLPETPPMDFYVPRPNSPR